MRCGVRGPQAGFSLAEMLVAIAIGGIMTAMAIPNFSQMRDGYRLRGATYTVFTALQNARMAAIKENNRYRFYINNNVYFVHDDLNNNGTEDAGESVTQLNIRSYAKDVSISSGATIVFAADGTAVTTGNVTVSNTRGTKTIAVSPAGRVKVNS